jgi:hypothetical protein
MRNIRDKSQEGGATSNEGHGRRAAVAAPRDKRPISIVYCARSCGVRRPPLVRVRIASSPDATRRPPRGNAAQRAVRVIVCKRPPSRTAPPPSGGFNAERKRRRLSLRAPLDREFVRRIGRRPGNHSRNEVEGAANRTNEHRSQKENRSVGGAGAGPVVVVVVVAAGRCPILVAMAKSIRWLELGGGGESAEDTWPPPQHP